ncbi:hypothetical protein N7467_002461 [Penicillium canescens]|nr:hypothetical protein N7467_002461 [Penicillium canescens]
MRGLPRENAPPHEIIAPSSAYTSLMALPLCLIWNLKMKPKQKMSIGGLFCFGWICIIVSTIRVVQLEAVNGVPGPSWLAMWATIEAAIGKASVDLRPVTFPGPC